MLENYMIMPRYEHGMIEEYWENQNRIWTEMEDTAWEDME